jgi:hypothetical protein
MLNYCSNSSVIYGIDNQVDCIFITKDDVNKLLCNIKSQNITENFEDILLQTKNAIDNLSKISDIKPILRKNESCSNAAQSMYCFGQSRFFREQYAASSRNSENFSQLQSIITVMETVFKYIANKFIFGTDSTNSSNTTNKNLLMRTFWVLKLMCYV